MLKFVMSALIGGVVAMTGSAAHACGGSCPAYVYYGNAAPAYQPAPPTAKVQAPQTAGRVYRSYSYDPAYSAPVPSYYRPMRPSYNESFQRQYDASRKIRGY